MENEVDKSHVTQFRRIGMEEAYNEDLKNKMAQGLAKIEHTYSKAYDDGKVDAVIHLQKFPALDAYEIKKFDLTVQQAGQDNKVSQTFYIGASKKIYDEDGNAAYRQNKYTLKEGYNLLSERPVFKQFVSKDGAPYEDWIKLNLQNKLANGNHETIFLKKPDFHLEQTLKEYSIKDLTNPQYTVSLMESLYRGNLQLTTFTPKDGQAEKLYVSPNLETGSINVYGADRKQIPTEKLIERNLIAKDFGEKLLQVEKLVQEQKQTQKQEQKQEQKQNITKEHKHRQKIS
ncbi:hypothetical protein A9P82_12945 [Arachidicoccus ginsenosidimutans]|uniref:hypothetical protein n=1 Tax=Arachidicoccus sp. BS20 TaxID=1850526 RepID=UPI0007F15675|nr:hypothetical protein [Arachidicoccus sp. BS20]ANI90110.1 hypothetical protein A9P82_12945 [Arachidicoccus sp. BS20]